MIYVSGKLVDGLEQSGEERGFIFMQLHAWKSQWSMIIALGV